eukprot:8422246-Karenia_brevis.AAC.1
MRPFAEAVERLTADEPEVWLELEGPAINPWTMQILCDSGTTSAIQHERWIKASSISEADRSSYEHEALLRVLEGMLVVDHLNTPSLQSAEPNTRRMQSIEEEH